MLQKIKIKLPKILKTSDMILRAGSLIILFYYKL
jgi:hypothetical protein